MTESKKLSDVTQKIDDFNDETKLNLKLHVEHELHEHDRVLPDGLSYGIIHEEIEEAVDKRIDEFTKNTDLKPKELYAYLELQLAQDSSLSKRQLHYLAYDHLARETSNRFLRKMFKVMRRRMK
ncbi:hypothetical protein ACFQAV_05415 [Companilactobacillus huachuanensis]|uniref:Phage protein n=1 Tax=Companilactobacillus huachuanensis TaxID=2559914 RepID=A0ABW1RM92_9LACO|nr:hypothetical protein [Companilactobacillus huachuanensis]